MIKLNEINRFVDEYAFLSNFYCFDMVIEGKYWASTEHMYMSCRTDDPQIKEMIRLCSTPYEAKILGRRLILIDNWDNIKDDVMFQCLKVKFGFNTKLGDMLLETVGYDLIEGNYWHDNYWGDCLCPKCENIQGKNMLGQLLMKVRDELEDCYKYFKY